MAIVVYGAGGIGCYVGGRLAASGSAVTFVGRPRMAGELTAHGLRLTDYLGADLPRVADEQYISPADAPFDFRRVDAHWLAGEGPPEREARAGLERTAVS